MSDSSDSPYAPPRASVADAVPAAPPPRPAAIDLAVTLIWIDFAISITAAILQMAKLKAGVWVPVEGGIYVAMLAFSAWVYIGVGNGRNWARAAYFILIVLSVLGTLVMVLRHMRPGDMQSTLDILLALVSLGLEIYVVVLLLSRPVREWFAGMKEREERA
jgi:hypothetical protein